MGINTYQMILLYVLLPLSGLGLIIFALVRGKHLGQKPVEIVLTKLGLSLKLDTLTLLILLGCVFSGVGVYFWYRGYESQVGDLKRKVEKVEAEKTTLDGVLERFRVYAMRFHLVFPKEEAINAKAIKTQAYIAKQSEVSPKLYEIEPLVGFSNDIWVKIDNLNPGDKLCIVAYEGLEKSWESADIEIPKTNIQMRRVKQ